MSMKKTDITKNLAKKLDGRMKAAGVPGRFGQGAAGVVDKREQRRLDSAAGLVAFACKLPADLVKRLHERVLADEAGVNALVAQALEKGLAEAGTAPKTAPADAGPAPQKKAPADRGAAPIEPGAAKGAAPTKVPAAKRAAPKKTPG